MQNLNLVIKSYALDRYYGTGVIFSGTWSTQAGWYRVVPGALIQGNFHDPNAWSYSVDHHRAFYGQILRRELNGLMHILDGTLFGSSSYIDYPTWDRSLVYNRALEKFNSKVRGNLDLAIDLAEAGSTRRMIAGVGKVLSFAKSRKWSTKDLANGWLQWQYGWRPLLSDIWEAADESARTIRKALTHVKARVTMPIRVNDKVQKNVHTKQVPVIRNGQGKQSCTISVTLRERVWDIDQWSSLNPVSLAWELIPYSFVVDWFIDVGSTLRNLESALLYNTSFVSGYVSELFVYEGKEFAMNNANGYADGNGTSTYEKIIDVKGSRRRIDFVRSKITSYPLPRTPTFKVDLGTQRLFSAAALLRQLLK